MAVWCDEGVFARATDIYLHETEHFKDLFLCLGPFHWTRVLLRCQGKLLHGSGPDDALIECGVFGPGVNRVGIEWKPLCSGFDRDVDSGGPDPVASVENLLAAQRQR